MELILLSNSTNHGEAMYAHAASELLDVTDGDRVTFVPFALADWDDYADRAIGAFEALGIEAVSAHCSRSPERAILDAPVLMVGGGNSFRLLDSLYRLGVLDGVRARVASGDCRYMGASAGTNVACPTIATTNDMPICRPPGSAAFALLPFQVNLHFVDADPASTHMGETREERIDEFLEENDCRVLALYEGAWLRVSGATARVTGPAHVFGREGSTSHPDGGDVSDLLRDRPSFGGGRRPSPGRRVAAGPNR